MPIRKRSSTKATQKTKAYVVLNPKGGLIVRTPATCTSWDNNFRQRITAGYTAPKTVRNQRTYEEEYEKQALGHEVYKVAKQKLRVVQPAEYLENSPYVIVLRTDVENLTTGKKLFLNHEDPAMRMLMIYVFITGEKISGVPELHIADID